MKKNIVILKGDGIGSEIINEAIRVLEKVANKFGHEFNFIFEKIGGDAIDNLGVPLTDGTVEKCKAADAVLLGAVGGNKWDNIDPSLRPEQGLLKLRKDLDLFANIRPTKLFSSIKDACPLKNEIIEGGIDFIVVRELTGGIYFGRRQTVEEAGEKVAVDTMPYSSKEVERIARVAFELALSRKKCLCSIDKANVLDTSKLWREVLDRVSVDYPKVTLSHMLVDNAAMQIIKNPSQFDVIVTENMFGDILSDEASVLAGSLGMMPSASMGDTTLGLFEPIHGSAPDIAGLNIANPIGTILSVALMLRLSFGLETEAKTVENAVERVLDLGYRTKDLGGSASCSEMGGLISENL